jgi:hypothetical protein
MSFDADPEIVFKTKVLFRHPGNVTPTILQFFFEVGSVRYLFTATGCLNFLLISAFFFCCCLFLRFLDLDPDPYSTCRCGIGPASKFGSEYRYCTRTLMGLLAYQHRHCFESVYPQILHLQHHDELCIVSRRRDKLSSLLVVVFTLCRSSKLLCKEWEALKNYPRTSVAPDPTIIWYPGSGSDRLLSRIPDPDPTNKRREKLNYLFSCM